MGCNKESDTIINQDAILYRDGNLEIVSCAVVSIINQDKPSFKIEVNGLFLNNNADSCLIKVTYNQKLMGVNIYAPLATDKYRITSEFLTVNTPYKEVLRVHFYPSVKNLKDSINLDFVYVY